MSDVSDQAPERTAVPLLTPEGGLPELVDSTRLLAAAVDRLAAGTGPLAVDAERASGFRYSNRAYLLQFRRAGAGTVLVDPIPIAGDLAPLAEVINPLEWVLHSADQDLPGLDELGMRPAALYDTELAGRLAGYERVGLAAIVERTLGFELKKGHGADDWSNRPLPETWLNYAALDVEVLLELRDAVAEDLESQGKTDWAAQEFEHVRLAGPPKPKPDRWRRTSQIHSLKSPRQLAAVRELWTARDELARKRDVAPGRVLPDSAIVAAATADPRTVDALRALPVFGGPRQRRSSALWMQALERARALSPEDLPPVTQPFTGPPPVNRWSRRNPEAAERLTAARAAITELSERVKVPVENLLTPELVRRLCWDFDPADHPGDLTRVTAEIDETLAAGGARPWQRELTAPLLAEALRTAPTHVTGE
ncbi:ribonuclease D [Rhodococcus sp. PvR044]|jgi:ribonuclease D|uniref:HRDC domain-containing protein n=1 Tax=Rhodococcus TaxID=1827 RepID=UPI000BCC17D2|nr:MULTISPECIES: ribonuclease D [Rhodococcus]MBP1158464.1 ribonuclease D [Rhodococcus sp. PvR099]MCZ4553981.1 ribonuclease D [Rhodococcus maanshanensis]PTR43890.1 ribonuclease D [Rhodococcus sp. OK611]SNX90708.1 ribonuclease D [Rhodococcus sp. OK270]